MVAKKEAAVADQKEKDIPSVLDLGAIGAELEPLYLLYKGEKYRVSRPEEMPFGITGKLRQAGDNFGKLMDKYEDLEAIKSLVAIYVPNFPLDVLETESAGVVNAITEYIVSISKRNSKIELDPKSSSPSLESLEDTQV